MGILIGLDIGQKRTRTALCIAETEQRLVGGRRECHYLIRFLERLPLGTSYLETAERLTAIETGIIAKTGKPPVLYIDVTGLGQPVIDLLEQRLQQSRLVAVYFTHGDQWVETGWNTIKLGKAFLVTKLQTLLETGALHLPRTTQAITLAQELREFEIPIIEQANDLQGAFRVGSHDDLITALGLSVQVEPLTCGIR